MIRLLTLAALALCPAYLAVTTASAGERTIVHARGPVSDGHPFVVRQGGRTVLYPVPPRPLQFGLIDGRRVLVDPATLEVVYRLHP